MKIWLLQVRHKHGENLYAYSTAALADAGVASYVAENWEEEMGDTPAPDDTDEAISEYFDVTEDYESYEINELEVDE